MEAARNSLHALWQPKRLRYSVLTGALVVLLLFLVTSKNTPSIRIKHASPGFKAENATHLPSTSNPQFHMIVPATSSNKHLCRLLLSTTALDYPAPIFIRWGTPEAKDPYVQHLAKVQGVLAYLATLAKRHDDDIVLIADGYDILFQLGPDVLLKRYFDVINEQNQALTKRFGKKLQDEYDIRQSIIIGADKISWPDDPTLPAQWAVPDSTLPRYAFGPQTDTGHWRHHNRPRWLNSGTIMGPIGHVRALFGATLEKIRFDHTTDSDQFYFAQVFSEQSYARTLLIDGPLENRTKQTYHAGFYSGAGYDETVTLKLPHLEPGQTTEYHVTLDYESKLFQTTAYYHQYLGWRKHRLVEDHEQKSLGSQRSSDGFPTDILSSPSPFPNGWPDEVEESHTFKNQTQGRKQAVSWRDLPLGVNAASGEIFGLLHHTPPKELRDIWYPRLWFYPHGEAIMKAALAINGTGNRPDGSGGGNVRTHSYITKIGDAQWHRYEPLEPKSATPGLRVGGGFTEAGEWQSWESLCQKHEGGIYHNQPEAGDKPWPYSIAPPPLTSSSRMIPEPTSAMSSASSPAASVTSSTSSPAASVTSSASSPVASSTSSASSPAVALSTSSTSSSPTSATSSPLSSQR